MAEDSILWTTNGTGDGEVTGYTQSELIRWMRQSFINDPTNEGVCKNWQNELEVAGVATPITVDTGAAYVYGFPYWNLIAAVNVAVPSPTVNTRIDYIVLRASWAAQTIRVTRIAGVEGGGAPALVQTDGVTWDMPLATISTTIAGVITVTDAREFLHPNIEVEAGMFNADVAGDGLVLSGGALAVNVDDATIEIDTDTLQIKTGGLDNTHLANRTRTLFIPATECYNSTDVGYQNNTARGWEMIDAKFCECYGAFRCPADFASAGTLQAIFEPAANGNAYVYLVGYYGADGEAYSTNANNTGWLTEAVTSGVNDQLTAALSLAALAADDYVLCKFIRDATNVADTISATLYFVGFLVSYTADM